MKLFAKILCLAGATAFAVLFWFSPACPGADAPRALAPAWIPQDTVMYVPDPDLDSMGQGDMVPGSTVYAYVRNTGSAPMNLAGLTWNGTPVEALAAAPPYAAVWWRLNPGAVPPGGIGEICLRLRTRLAGPGRLGVVFTNAPGLALTVRPERPAFRIQTLAVSPDRRQVYIYVEKEGRNIVPASVLLDGRPVDGKVTWLGPGYTGLLRIAMVEMRAPLAEGAWHTWTVRAAADPAAQAGATLRIISDPVAMGMSGTTDFQRLSSNGMTACHIFQFPGMETMQAAADYKIRIHAQAAPAMIESARDGHPGMMGYNIFDEPDCKDDAAGQQQGRPWGERLGISAPEMAGLVHAMAARAPQLPVFMTLDMTFIPGNYYTYGPIPDILTPDFYPITHARSVAQVRIAAAHAKRATAPRPLGFIYQCNREDWSIDISGPPYNGWAGRDVIRDKGRDYFRDAKRTRGFGRAPAGEEIELQVAYLLGEGVKNFWGYGDSSECCQGLLFQGAIDVPGAWDAVSKMARTLSWVKTEIGLAHPFPWARSDRAKVRVSTLVCGRDRALVVAINEDYHSVKEGFTRQPAGATAFVFPDLPWLKAQKIELVTPAGFVPCRVSRGAGAAGWKHASLEATAVFRVAGVER